MKSLTEITGPIQHINILRHFLPDDGQFPNNILLPLLVYRKSLHLPSKNPGKAVKEIFESNGWTNAWENGIYDYHHYHSTAHEVLAMIQGSVRVQFGGPSGISLSLEEGDVVIIPAGVAHKNIGGHTDFVCVGAYPDGQQYDIKYGRTDERPAADKNIKQVPLPETDPVYGMSGPLIKNWETDPNKIENEVL
jgi:uncharacterized protein YjlB